ncbi:accessory gene regulator ArgB-like protein [Paenibacillus sp. NPDC057934]|uniref:accessory gene regulator ArgB-like protein n=1 Tax=Paenibacillus sp. NPDC057934 TaxID=3346282 RepID=UPI0036DADB42
MESLATKIAIKIKNSNPEETYSVDVMKYSLGIILNTSFVFLVSMLLGYLSGRFTETLVLFFAFITLRLCSGGYHFQTARSCNIVSILIFTITPHLSNYSNHTLLIINVFCLIIMILFSPTPDRNTQIPIRWYPYLKAASISLVLLNYWLQSPVIGLAFLAQSITIIFTLVRRKDIYEEESR